MGGVPPGHRHLDHRRHRLDGDAARLHRGRRRRHQARRDRPGRTRLPRDDPGRERRPGARRAARAARRAGTHRLPLPLRRTPADLRAAGLEHHRRHLRPGRGRVLLVPGPQRRHDHLGRLQHRRTRGRGGAAGSPRRTRGRRRGCARPGPRHDRAGVCRAPRRRPPSCRTSPNPRSPRTSTRGWSSSSPSCPRPSAARPSATGSGSSPRKDCGPHPGKSSLCRTNGGTRVRHLRRRVRAGSSCSGDRPGPGRVRRPGPRSPRCRYLAGTCWSSRSAHRQ
jgi:hypothetical protein